MPTAGDYLSSGLRPRESRCSDTPTVNCPRPGANGNQPLSGIDAFTINNRALDSLPTQVSRTDM